MSAQNQHSGDDFPMLRELAKDYVSAKRVSAAPTQMMAEAHGLLEQYQAAVEALRVVYRATEWTEADFADDGVAWQVRSVLEQASNPATSRDDCSNCDGKGHNTGWPHTTCPVCEGTGKEPDPASELHECPYCDGRGWNTIAVHDPTDPDGEPLPEQEQCATCGGSGEVSRPASEPEAS